MHREDRIPLFGRLHLLGSSLDERVVVEGNDGRLFAVPRPDKAVQPSRRFGLGRSCRMLLNDCSDLMAYEPR